MLSLYQITSESGKSSGVTVFISLQIQKIFISFLEKTSMFRIKVCQAMEYNVTDFIPGSPVTKYFLKI